jgi:hypothetical protein
MSDDTKVWLSDMIKTVGFPIVMCIALMWGGYSIFTTFITPAFTKQMETLEVVTETQGKLVERLGAISMEVQAVKATQVAQQTILTELTTTQKDTLSTLKEIEKNTAKK